MGAQTEVKTEAAAQSSFWGQSGWFSGSGGLQESQQAADTVLTSSSTPDVRPEQRSSAAAPGGAKAQARFSGTTALPLYHSVPLSSRQLDPQPKAAQPYVLNREQPGVARHAAYKRDQRGHTCDGSLPDPADRGTTSRWVFNVSRWRWEAKGDSLPLQEATWHQVAARRWGDGRDALAHVAGGQTSAAQAGLGESSSAGVKRARVQVQAVREPADGFAAVGGLARQKSILMEQVVLPLRHPALFRRLGVAPGRGVLLHGPPGSGKTHLVRALAAESGIHLEVLNGGECVGGEKAEARVRRAFAAACSQAPSILFLDELDAVAPAPGPGTSENERQAAARLMAALDGLRAKHVAVAVVAATHRRYSVHTGLRRPGRLDTEVALGALDAAEREQVLRVCTSSMPLAPGVDLPALAARLHGRNAADCAGVCTEAALRCAAAAVEAAEDAGQGKEVGQPGFLEALRVGSEEFEAALQELGPAVLRSLVAERPEPLTWEQVGGLEEAKEQLRELVELPLRHGALLKRMGLPPPRGALLYGPPGCGKTLLARAAASCCGANFLSVRGPELLQKWLGESERAVRDLFEAARAAAPCLVFLDEVDALAPRRGSGGGSSAGGDAAAARVLTQLLVEMDGVGGREGVVVLAATNRPEALDPALLRPGRLDSLVKVALPEEAARLGVLQAALRRCPLAPCVNLPALAAGSEGMSGADLAEGCRRAGMAALREWVAREQAQQQQEAGGSLGAGPQAGAATEQVEQRHLAEAFGGMHRSVSEREAQHFDLLEQHLREGTLPPPSRATGGQQAALQRAVAQVMEGAAGRQLERLQQRVALLEVALQEAGLPCPTEE